MAQIKNLIARWDAAWPSPMIISRQYDNCQFRIDLMNYPEPEYIVDEQTEQMEILSYYLIVWMKETEDGEYREMSPIMLPGPYWIVPNQYTQLVQDIRFQFCVQSDSTDYEAHSAIFTGRVVDSIEHDGTAIDVIPVEMFDAYKAYIQEIAMAAGAVVIDPNLDTTGAAADAKATGDKIAAAKPFVVQVPGSAAVYSGSITSGDFAKALAAYTAGSGVYAVKDGEVYQLSAAGSATMTFTLMYHGTMNYIKQIEITSGDTFAVTNTALSSSAEDTAYDNTTSGLAATNVQDAIDENAANLSETNERLDDVKETVDAVTDTEIISTAIFEKEDGSEVLPDGCSSTLGYLRSMSASNSGSLTGTTSEGNKTFWVQADEDMDVYLDPVKMGNQYKYICIFNDSPYGSSHRATPVFSSGSSTYPFPAAENPVHVEAGQYITFSYFNGPTTLAGTAWVLYKVERGETTIKSTVPLTNMQTEEVSSLIDETDEALFVGNGYLHLDEAKFSRHAWTSYSATDNRDYRVRYTEPIEFDRDVFLMAELGFFIAGFKSDGTGIGTENTCYKLPANTPVKIYIRRISESSSEVADIHEFATAVKISTPLAPIEKFDYTFTDLSMFPRIGLGGDSYTNGGGIISGIRPLTWGKNLERQIGSIVDIYAKSGENVVGWATNTDHGLPALLAGEECGLYWLAHGINGPTGENLGTIADCAEETKPATFYGQYGYCIEQIQATFPKAKIVLQTIMGTSYELYQKTYSSRNVAIKEIAEYYSIPVIDLIDDDFYRSKWYSSCMRSNHPTAMLNAGIAHANRRLFSKCVQNNPSYFVDYGS